MKKIKKILIIGIVTLLLIGSSNLSFGMGGVVKSFDSPGDNPKGLVWIGDYLWCSDLDTEKIYKINPSNGNVIKSYDLPSTIYAPRDLAWDGSYLWLADSFNNKIYKIQIGVLVLWFVGSFDSPGDDPTGLTWDGNYLWNADYDTDKIYKINPSNGNVVDSFDSPGSCPCPYGLAWDDGYLWLADNCCGGTIYKIDPSDGNVKCSFDPPGTLPTGLTWDGEYLWLADYDYPEKKIYKIEVEDDAPTAQYTWVDADGDGPGTVINFDASSSTDDCGIVSYKWDWDNNGQYDYTDTDPYCSHDYGDSENYNCKLMVIDCEGQTDTITKTVHATANDPPTVEITYPNEGDIIGGTVTVTGTASDSDGGVNYVQVKIDNGQWYTASGTTSWSWNWDTTNYGKGMHTVSARSYDGEDYSDVYSVTVYVNQPPTVDITYPEDGDTVVGTVIITGTAGDPDGNSDVDSVKVKIEDGNWELASGTTSWSYSWNTEDYEDGTYTIYARSYDGVSYSEIDSVMVYVNNYGGGNNPPWLNGERPEDGSSDVDIDTDEISIYIGDSEDDSFDWSISTSPNVGSSSGTNDNSGRKTCDISGLDYSTTYTWTVVATDPDGSGETTTEIYSFTTEASVNNPPILRTYSDWSDGISPDFGKPGTEFTFKVHYYDEDGHNPSVKYLKVKDPDGIWYKFTMQGSGSNSVYDYSMIFYTPGEYFYYFYFEDGHGGSDQLLPTQPYWNFNVIQKCANKPSWGLYQKWTYRANNLKITQSGINVDFDPFNLELKVIQIYPEPVLSFEADVTGDVSVILNSGNQIEGTLKDTELDGNIYFDNSDLGLKRVTFSMDGIIVRPILDYDFDFDAEVKPKDGLYEFFDFPICEDDLWMIYEETLDVSYSYKIGKFPKVSKDFEETIMQHGVECRGVETINGYEALYLISGSIGEYWYSPTREGVIQAIGSVMGFEADFELTASPPYKPSTPQGKTNVKVGETCTYTTSTTDPNGDRIMYGWDWNGDKIVDEWTTSVYRSGDNCSVSHTWTSEEVSNGNTQIFVRAKDVRGEDGLWSNHLPVTLTRNRILNRPLLNFLQSHPNMFPLLQKLLQRLGL